MTTPAFSVIIPIYNARDTLEETVRSVLVQTDPDFELLLIDDGSRDDSLAVMITLACEDARIRIVAKDNQGVAMTRNLGIELARGALIAFLDADDLWHPEKLARHRELHNENPDVAGSYARIAFLEADAANLADGRTQSTVPSGDLGIEQVLGENPVCTTSNLVVTRDCIAQAGGFRAGMDHAEDQEWLARALSDGHRITGIDCLLVGYRTSDTGLSADLRRMYAGWRSLTSTYREKIDLAPAEAIFCRYLARRALRTAGPSGDALRFSAAGMRCSPAAFLADRRRGGMTLAGALLSPLLPTLVRTRLFA